MKLEAFKLGCPTEAEVIQVYEAYSHNNKWENGKLVGRGISKFS